MEVGFLLQDLLFFEELLDVQFFLVVVLLLLDFSFRFPSLYSFAFLSLENGVLPYAVHRAFFTASVGAVTALRLAALSEELSFGLRYSSGCAIDVRVS